MNAENDRVEVHEEVLRALASWKSYADPSRGYESCDIERAIRKTRCYYDRDWEQFQQRADNQYKENMLMLKQALEKTQY